MLRVEISDANHEWVAKPIDLTAAFRLQERTSKKTGKVSRKNFRIDIEGDHLFINLEASDLNGAFAENLKELIREQIRKVTETVSAATLARRQRSRRNTQTKSYAKRYGGGRIGETPPSTSIRKLNDSGRLANNLTVRARRRSSGESAVTINVPANRFDPRTGGNVDNIIADAQRLVPILGGDFSKTPEVGKMLGEIMDNAIALSEAELRSKLRKLRKLQIVALRAVVGI